MVMMATCSTAAVSPVRVTRSAPASFRAGSAFFAPTGVSGVSNGSVTTCAVPKSRGSKQKKRSRRANWMAKGRVAADQALALGKSVLTGRSTSFRYLAGKSDKDEEDEE